MKLFITHFWRWLGTPNASRSVSVVLCIYLFIATIGHTQSYWHALNFLVMFCSAWGLGFHSRARSTQGA